MEPAGMDFIKYLENDMVLNIFNRLDLADVVRACIVSPGWRDFVVGSEVCKQLCLRQFPQVADVVDVRLTVQKRKRKPRDVGGELIPWRNHRVYASLLYALQKLIKSSLTDCIRRKFSVSKYPSKGLKDHDIPHTLIFKLKYDQCVITEIDIRPFREYLKGIQLEKEEYSTKSVRFRMGFPESAANKSKSKRGSADDSFIWTYTSPEFPINRTCQPLPQGGRGQRFKFPEPVLCIGGFVMIELLGRVQMDEQKGPYYIEIEDVDVRGRSLSPAFKAKVEDQSGKLVLSYDASRLRQTFILRRQTSMARMQPMRLATCACACSNSIGL